MRKLYIIIICFALYCTSLAQVTINRYAEPKISSKGLHGKSDSIKKVVIPEIDIKSTIAKWETENKPLKFAEPVIVDIFMPLPASSPATLIVRY